MSKTDKTMLDDHALDAFFDAARRDVAEPSDTLIAAILADAEAHQPSGVTQPEAKAEAASGLWRRFVSGIGGWPAAASMATAAVAGVWIGFASPTQLEVLSGGLILSGDYTATSSDYALEDLAPSYLDASLFSEDEG